MKTMSRRETFSPKNTNMDLTDFHLLSGLVHFFIKDEKYHLKSLGLFILRGLSLQHGDKSWTQRKETGFNSSFKVKFVAGSRSQG